MASTIKGIVATPVTPFTADNRLDEAASGRLADFLIRAGAHAVCVPMHIGESLNLSTEERRRLAEVAVRAAAGRVPVLIHVSLPGTDQVIDLARHAQTIGAAGVVAITPYHWQPSQDALFAHFEAVGSAVEIAVVAYNFPLRLGVTISPGLLGRLLDRLENFTGVKDASLDMEYFTEMCRTAAERGREFSVFTGVEYMLPSMVLGGAGSFSACGGVAPRLVRDLHAACACGRYAEARALQYRLSRLWSALKIEYPSAIKAAMGLMGRPVGKTRLPVPPLGREQMQRLEHELAATGVLETEPYGW